MSKYYLISNTQYDDTVQSKDCITTYDFYTMIIHSILYIFEIKISFEIHFIMMQKMSIICIYFTYYLFT